MTKARWNLLAGLLLVIAGCSSGVTVDGTLEPLASLTSSTSTVAVGSTSSSSTMPRTTTSTLSGREVEIGPAAGVSLSVVGVDYGDVLNIRAGPGMDQAVIAAAEPTMSGLIAQGKTRMLPNGALWIEVQFAGVTGWVYLGHVAVLGGTEDATAFVVEQLGEYPTTNSMREMGEIVANVFASSEPPSHIVMVSPATQGDVVDIAFDVIGVGDDAISGYRIRVFAVPVSDGLGFHSAELTTLCSRGVTSDELCT